MNKNKNTNTIIGIVILTIIVLAAIILYFYSRPKKNINNNAPSKTQVRPVISLSNELLKNSTTENYKIMTEYYTLAELSKGVEIQTNLNITDSYLIKTLTVTRTNVSTPSFKEVFTFAQENIKDTPEPIIFKRIEGENMIGDHTIIINYTTSLDTVDDKPEPIQGKVTISESDLSLLSIDGVTTKLTLTTTFNNGIVNTKNIPRINPVVKNKDGINIFGTQAIYFSPISGTNNKGINIMNLKENQRYQLGGTSGVPPPFYILNAGASTSKKMIGTTETENENTKYISYNPITNDLSLSKKEVQIDNKLFTISF